MSTNKGIENECRLLSFTLVIIFFIIFETPKTDVKRISKIIIDEMTSVVNSDHHSFSIPLTVDLNIGDNWGELH